MRIPRYHLDSARYSLRLLSEFDNGFVPDRSTPSQVLRSVSWSTSCGIDIRDFSVPALWNVFRSYCYQLCHFCSNYTQPPRCKRGDVRKSDSFAQILNRSVLGLLRWFFTVLRIIFFFRRIPRFRVFGWRIDRSCFWLRLFLWNFRQ